jgi:hypothetical protein
MASQRENRVYSTVACPECRKPVGRACVLLPDGRPYVHPARRRAFDAMVGKPTLVGTEQGEAYEVTFVLRTPIQFESEEFAAEQIGPAIKHHLRKAGVTVVGMPTVRKHKL